MCAETTTKEFLDQSEDLMVSRVGEDSCLIQTQKATLVLSYDAAYDLAIRLAHWLETVQSSSAESASLSGPCKELCH